MFIIENAVISAAGIGSRLGLGIPKCLVEIGGKSLIAHQIDALSEVKNLRVVVGFREEDVIEEVLRFRRDVVFVRNPNFASTGNCTSLYLATKDIKEKFLTIDGDLLFYKHDFHNFISSLRDKEVVVLTPTATEEAISAELTEKNDLIASFRAGAVSDLEWSGIAYINNLGLSDYQNQYIYKFLENKLPLSYHQMKVFEIDTPADYYNVLSTFRPEC